MFSLCGRCGAATKPPAHASLSRYLLAKYLDTEEAGGDDFKMYYKLANLDDRIKNADQVGIGETADWAGSFS